MNKEFLEIRASVKTESGNFDRFMKCISNEQLIKDVEKHTKNISARYYLSAWMLYLFPDITMNKNMDKELHGLAKNVYNVEEVDELYDTLSMFKKRFDEWKKRDKQIVTESIFMQYHNSGVDLLNAETEDDKEIIKEIRKGLLETARRIGGDQLCNEILSMKPIVIDINKLGAQFNNAFWDTLKNNYDNGDYTLFIQIIEHIKGIFKAISPNKHQYIDETMDIEYILRVMQSKGRDEYMGAFVMTVLDFIKEHQAAVHDKRLKEVRDMIGNEEKRVDIMRGIVELSEQIVIDINNNKMYNK